MKPFPEPIHSYVPLKINCNECISAWCSFSKWYTWSDWVSKNRKSTKLHKWAIKDQTKMFLEKIAMHNSWKFSFYIDDDTWSEAQLQIQQLIQSPQGKIPKYTRTWNNHVLENGSYNLFLQDRSYHFPIF